MRHAWYNIDMKNMICLSGFGIFGVCLAGVIVLALLLFVILVPINEYFKCLFSHAHVGALRLRAMKKRGLPYKMICEWYIYSKKARLNLSLDALEVHFVSNGNLQNVVLGAIYAKDACVDLSLDTIKVLDLEKKDIKQVVDESLSPKVISTGEFKTVSIDEKEVIIEINISVKVKLNNYLKGTKEDVLISKVKESVVCSVAGEESKDVLTNFDVFTKIARVKCESDDSALKVVDMNVVSARLGKDYNYEKSLQEKEHEGQMELIEIDKKRAEAQLEEQKLKNKVQEERLRRAELESEMLKKLGTGDNAQDKLSMIDYYKLQNLIADTDMRKSILSSITNNKKSAAHDDDD